MAMPDPAYPVQAAAATPQRWTVHGREEFGPLTQGQLRELALRGELVGDSVLVVEGTEMPVPARSVPRLFSSRSHLTALAVAGIAGTVGADRFYLGRHLTGLAKLLLVVVPLVVILDWRFDVPAGTTPTLTRGDLPVAALLLLALVANLAWTGLDMVRIAARKLPDADGRPLA